MFCVGPLRMSISSDLMSVLRGIYSSDGFWIYCDTQTKGLEFAYSFLKQIYFYVECSSQSLSYTSCIQTEHAEFHFLSFLSIQNIGIPFFHPLVFRHRYNANLVVNVCGFCVLSNERNENFEKTFFLQSYENFLFFADTMYESPI